MPKYLTIKQVVQHTGLSWSLVYTLFHNGTLKGFRAGRAIRIDPESLEALTKAKAPEQPQPGLEPSAEQPASILPQPHATESRRQQPAPPKHRRRWILEPPL